MCQCNKLGLKLIKKKTNKNIFKLSCPCIKRIKGHNFGNKTLYTPLCTVGCKFKLSTTSKLVNLIKLLFYKLESKKNSETQRTMQNVMEPTIESMMFYVRVYLLYFTFGKPQKSLFADCLYSFPGISYANLCNRNTTLCLKQDTFVLLENAIT